MRGIAFIGGDGPDRDIGMKALGRFDRAVAADSGLIAAERWQVRCDLIVGDMDSIDDTSRLDKYPPDTVIRLPTDKDETDTEAALRLLAGLGCTERILIGGGGGRLDHTLAIVALFDRGDVPDRWITALEDVRLLDAGVDGHAELRSSVRPHSLVSVFPLGEGPWIARSDGLRWALDELRWKRGEFGISNVAETGTFSVSAERGRFLVITPLV